MKSTRLKKKMQRYLAARRRDNNTLTEWCDCDYFISNELHRSEICEGWRARTQETNYCNCNYMECTHDEEWCEDYRKGLELYWHNQQHDNF